MLRNSFKNAATWEKSAFFFFFFFSYQKLGVRLIHVCAVYTRLYGNENIRKCKFFLSCYCRAEKYGFPQQNTDFGVWEYWKAQIQLGSSGVGILLKSTRLLFLVMLPQVFFWLVSGMRSAGHISWFYLGGYIVFRRIHNGPGDTFALRGNGHF